MPIPKAVRRVPDRAKKGTSGGSPNEPRVQISLFGLGFQGKIIQILLKPRAVKAAG